MNNSTSSKIDWSVLSGTLLVLVISLLGGVTLIVGTQQYYQSLTKWELEQRNVFGQLQSEYGHLREALAIVNTFYYGTFNELIKQGFFQEKLVGSLEEQRLRMVSEIEGLIEDLKLPAPATYELTEQTLYIIPSLSTEDQFKTYETKLILKLGLLHEEDMLRLIETIEFQQFPGLFNLQKCEIKRLQETISLKDATKANLQALCVLAWYTSTLVQEAPK